MRREGAIHGWMKSYNEEQSRFRYSKRPTKGTNASKDSGKCRRSKCRGCHESPASKAMSKVKGQNKKHGQDVIANPELFDWSLAKGGKARKRNWEEDMDEVVPWSRTVTTRSSAQDGFDEEECARAIAESLAVKEEAKGAGFGPGEEEEDGYSSAGCEPLPSDEDFHRALGEREAVFDEVDAQVFSEEEGLSTDDEAFESWEEEEQQQQPPKQQQQHEASSEADDDDDGTQSDGSGWSLCSLDEEEEEFVEIEEQDWAMI